MDEWMTDKERGELDQIGRRIGLLQQYLSTWDLNSSLECDEWMKRLLEIRRIQGNTNTGASFVASLLAKQFLANRFGFAPFDATEKRQAANGLDIDFKTPDGKRVIGEIKTTVPYKGEKLGGNQETAIRKDFARLAEESASFKFFFVTDPMALEIVQSCYGVESSEIEIVLLPEAMGGQDGKRI